MKRKHTVDIFSGDGLDELIKGLDEYERWINRKAEELAKRLAEYGRDDARIGFASAIYDGPRDSKVDIEPRGENCWSVVASGQDVLFIEFGTGITYSGVQHPESNGYGPGTYPIPPGKGHWDDTSGWYLPKEAGGGHTYGNPANMPMYYAVKYLEQDFRRIVQEVFSD